MCYFGTDISFAFFQVLILRNFGAICVGETIEETAYLAHLLVTACGLQVCFCLERFNGHMHLSGKK